MPKLLARIVAVLLVLCVTLPSTAGSLMFGAGRQPFPVSGYFASQALATSPPSFRPPGVTGIASEITRKIATYSGASEEVYNLIWRIYLFQMFVKNLLPPTASRRQKILFKHLTKDTPAEPKFLLNLPGVQPVTDLKKPLQSLWNKCQMAMNMTQGTLLPDQAKVLQALRPLGDAGYRLWRSIAVNQNNREFLIRIVTGGDLHGVDSALAKLNALLTQSLFYKLEKKALADDRKPWKMLYRREKEVLGYLLLGFPKRDISEALGIGIGTVESHCLIIGASLKINHAHQRDANLAEKPEIILTPHSSTIPAGADALPSRVREVFELKKTRHSSRGDIAKEMGISRHTVDQHLKTIRAAGLLNPKPPTTAEASTIRALVLATKEKSSWLHPQIRDINNLIWRIYLFQKFIKDFLAPTTTTQERERFEYFFQRLPPTPAYLLTKMRPQSFEGLTDSLESLWEISESAIVGALLAAQNPLSPSQVQIVAGLRQLGAEGYRLWRELSRNKHNIKTLIDIVTGEQSVDLGKSLARINELLTNSLFYKIEEMLAADSDILGNQNPQERQVLEFLRQGFSQSAISSALNIDRKTITIHRSHILFKLKIYDARRRISA